MDDPNPASDPLSAAVSELEAIVKRGPSKTDREFIARRRQLTGYLYCVRRMNLRQIVAYLAKEIDPPIKSNLVAISRDVQAWRQYFRDTYAANKYDALSEVGRRIASYDSAAAKAWALMVKCKDPKDQANLLRVFNESNAKAIQLLQDVGLLDRRIGTLLVGDTSKSGIDVMPSGAELQKLFESVTVIEGELVSEAEKAWMYGDAQASNDAAAGATDGEISKG